MRPIRQTLVCLAVALTSITAQANEAALTPQAMRKDLKWLKEEWAPLDRSFSDTHRKAFHQLVDQTSVAADRLAPDAFAMEVMRAVAVARNGHTSANVAQFLGDDLPIRASWFAEGLYIVKTHPDFANLLGARIERIGSLTPEQAHEKIKPYLAGTDQRVRFLSPGYLVNPLVLKHIGATDSADRIPLAVHRADGSAEALELQPIAMGDPGDERKAGLNRGYSVLIPDPQDLPGRWRHLLDTATNLSPRYTPRTDVSSAFLDDRKSVLYIRNDTGVSLDETPLTDKFAGIVLGSLLPSRPKHIIVDLRLNNGGDLFNSILFARALPRLIPPEGRVFVLVGRATFSAGLSTAAMLEGEGRDQVMLIGEMMGDAASFWSEGKKLKLPHSGIEVRYSPEFHDYEKGCTDPSTCYWPVVAFGPRGISIAPDITVDVRFADYATGRDPVLEKALELAR